MTAMLLQHARSSTERVEAATSSGIELAIGAVIRLAGASSARILIFDRLTETISPLLTVPPAGSAGPTIDFDDAIRAEMDSLFPSQPRWIEPGERDGGTALLLKLQDRAHKTFFIAFGFDEAGAAARARLMRLVPDLVTLIRFHLNASAHVRAVEERSGAAEIALDHGDCGVIAVRRDHSVIFSNAAASAVLAEEVELRVRRGVLRTVEHQDSARFAAALDQVIEPPQRQPGRKQRAIVMLLKRRDGARPTIIAVVPTGEQSTAATRTGARAGGGRGAAALVYVLQPMQGTRSGLEALCQLHGLSGVEGRLLVHLTGGLTLAEAAAEMRIKIETARTYLKQIFGKTGTHRQTELVTLMARYLRAVRGNFDFQPA